MRSQERKAFADLREFREYTRTAARVVHYLVFRGTPDPNMIDPLSECGAGEALVPLDIDEGRGFLAATDVTVDILPDRKFVTKKMADRPDLGAWARGAPLDFVDRPDDVQGLVAYARRLTFPAENATALAHADIESV